MKVGDGSSPETEMGPVIRADHRERIDRWVREGVAAGAIIAARGESPSGQGFFTPPVLFDRVTPDMEIAQATTGPIPQSAMRPTNTTGACSRQER